MDTSVLLREAPASIAVIGNHLPRQCGIATFTTDLVNALSAEAPDVRSWAMVMNDTPGGYPYPPRVRFELDHKNIADYRLAADYLNMNQIDVVCLQHEFGIFGGQNGRYIIELIDSLRMPVITTLHTVHKDPEPGRKKIIQEIGRISERLVVMSRKAQTLLHEVYGIPEEKTVLIHHGIPDVPFVDPNYFKDQFGVEGKKVILTFGLLSPGKGIETMIEALPGIVREHPEAVYIVLGATHPHVKKVEGESYRIFLQQRARELGVEKNIIFHNRFVSLRELTEFLGSADIYVTPYLNREQIASGTLAYALGTGKATVSTPYWYAEEMLADERGRLVFQTKTLNQTPQELPRLNLDHLKLLTDDVGILQHAKYTVPDRSHGYCTDDNARALIAVLMAQELVSEGKELNDLACRYLSFLDHALSESNGFFRNFMGYDRRWLEEQGSEDSHGRAIWGLGMAVALSHSENITAVALNLFEKALQTIAELTSPRAVAFALVGIHAYLRKFSGDSEVRRLRASLAGKLLHLYQSNAADDWPWIEDIVTYANGKIPQALLLSGQWLQRGDMIAAGLRSLDWLARIQTDPKGHFVPIGNRGWHPRGGDKARFDQQPIEAQSMIDACIEAYYATQDRRWVDEARRCFEWFLGRNDLNVPLYDYATGGCRDGLTADGPNLNQGAESTLAWLLSLLSFHYLMEMEADEPIPPGPPAETEDERNE